MSLQTQRVQSLEQVRAFLIPMLESLIGAFPFEVKGFHADNGSEYINHRVAELLSKLHVGEFTKSRARRTNDNALVEGKNASVIRKWLGYSHIPAPLAEAVNTFNRDWLSPFLIERQVRSPFAGHTAASPPAEIHPPRAGPLPSHPMPSNTPPKGRGPQRPGRRVGGRGGSRPPYRSTARRRGSR